MEPPQFPGRFKLAQAISDVSLGMFRSQMEYKAKRYGTWLVITDC